VADRDGNPDKAEKPGMKEALKRLLFGRGRRIRKIPLGLFAGLNLSVDPGSESSLWLGLYEAELTSWLRRAGRQARSVVDVGAGHGELTAWALRQPRVEKVLAYEPDQARWPVMAENLQANGFSRDKRLQMVKDFLTPARAPQDLRNLPEPVLLKLDVEGAEKEILENLQDLLGRKLFLILVEVHSAAIRKETEARVRASGYRVTSIPRGWWRCLLPERRILDFNQWFVAEKKEGS
jgi:predicted RNA methylase